jgi:hypothetical protein
MRLSGCFSLAWCLGRSGDRTGAPDLVGFADVDEWHRVGLEFAAELIDGGLINWPANQRAGQRMRGLELDSTLVTERFPTEETGPVTDQRRCATG